MKRIQHGTIDLRAMIVAPVGTFEVPQEVVAEAFVAVPSRTFTEILSFGLIFVTLITLTGTMVAYSARLADSGISHSVGSLAAVTINPISSNTPNASAASPIVPAVATVTPDSTRLQAILDTFTAADRSSWRIVVTDLKTGETASVNGGTQTESASLYKLFVAQGIYKAIDNGTMNYSDAAGSGSGMDIRTCLKYMITISDNTCGRALGVKLGWQAMNPGLNAAGFVATDMTGPAQQTSAADVALVFNRLYNGTLLSPNSSSAFTVLLKGQLVNDRLPKGLPAGTVFAHKTGDLDGYAHDAGIVYGPKTDYIVSVMSGPWNSSASQYTRFGTLSSELYAYFEQ